MARPMKPKQMVAVVTVGVIISYVTFVNVYIYITRPDSVATVDAGYRRQQTGWFF
jgi:hypothetical protein